MGAVAVLGGYFTAVNWKTGESDWTFGAGLLVVGGIVFAVYCLYGAVRPTKISFLPPTILFALWSVFGAITVIVDLASGSAT